MKWIWHDDRIKNVNIKSDEYKWMWWTDTEMNRNKKEKEAQSSTDKWDHKLINKKNVYTVAVA